MAFHRQDSAIPFGSACALHAGRPLQKSGKDRIFWQRSCRLAIPSSAEAAHLAGLCSLHALHLVLNPSQRQCK